PALRPSSVARRVTGRPPERNARSLLRACRNPAASGIQEQDVGPIPNHSPATTRCPRHSNAPSLFDRSADEHHLLECVTVAPPMTCPPPAKTSAPHPGQS